MGKIGRLLTRLTSLTLSAIILATALPIVPSITVQADDGYTGVGDGKNGGFNSGWRANWNANQQGVRVSIVDHDGNCQIHTI